MKLSSRPKRLDILAARADDAIVFMHVRTGQYLLLEDTAREIWELIDGQRAISDIIEEIRRIYRVDDKTCTGEVIAFFSELRKKEMIEIID